MYRETELWEKAKFDVFPIALFFTSALTTNFVLKALQIVARQDL